MGGWGTGSFENDEAQNFLGRLNSVEVGDLKQMLANAADRDYMDAPESSVVIAVAEVVATARGKPSAGGAEPDCRMGQQDRGRSEPRDVGIGSACSL